MVIDALDECARAEWADLRALLQRVMTELPAFLCVIVTVRSRCARSRLREAVTGDL